MLAAYTPVHVKNNNDKIQTKRNKIPSPIHNKINHLNFQVAGDSELS